MRVGVTGASGLVGHALVEALHERDDTTVIFVRPSSAPASNDTVRWDPARGVIDEGDLNRVGGLDAVVNLAGAGIGDRRWNESRKREILDSRVAATTLLVSALGELSNGGGFLANASAIGWYGSRGDENLDEASTRGEGFLSDVCVAWEKATSPLEVLGLDVAHARSGVVLSSRGGAFKKQLPLFRSGLGGRYGAGSQWMSVISLHDEVRALLWTIDHRLTGPVNLVAPQPITNREFTRVLARILRRPAALNVPSWTLRAVLGAEMADELILTSQRVTPTSLRSSNFKFEHDDANEALKWVLRSTGSKSGSH
ncbi:MAG TPA: TIGR01777 family oxidoreductase [Acidimicrobiales bacterium]|nr:TIGR01777 family oxidoreductase [Acidimicrobiales bacterium]